jgi:hypothetical protein
VLENVGVIEIVLLLVLLVLLRQVVLAVRRAWRGDGAGEDGRVVR